MTLIHRGYSDPLWSKVVDCEACGAKMTLNRSNLAFSKGCAFEYFDESAKPKMFSVCMNCSEHIDVGFVQIDKLSHNFPQWDPEKNMKEVLFSNQEKPEIPPKIGLGCFVRNMETNKILVTLRGDTTGHGQGTWCSPGGHMRQGETFIQCARREVLEETGANVRNVRFVTTTEDFFPGGKHYLTVFMIADYVGGNVHNAEEHLGKCLDVAWMDFEEFKTKNLFIPTQNLLKRGYHPFENDGLLPNGWQNM